MRKSLTLIATLAACTLMAYIFWNMESPFHEEEEEEEHHHHHNLEEEHIAFSKEQLQEHGISLQKAIPGTLQQTIKVPAKITVIPDNITHILPKVSGVAVRAYKNIGETVEAGEKLAIFESREIAEAKAEYMAALKKERMHSEIFQREQNLHEKGVSSTQDFLAVKNAWEEAGINLSLAHQKLHALGMNESDIAQILSASPEELRFYEIRSPIAGRVVSRHLNPGEFVSNDHETYVIADLDKIWAEVSVFPQDRPFVKQGQKIGVIAPDGRKVRGTVIFLSPMIEEDTRTSKAFAELDNSKGVWLPGSFTQAELVIDTIRSPLVIPKSAIQNIDGTDVVFIPTAEGFDIRPIVKGKSDDKYCEIRSGLEPGDPIACTNTFLLKAELQKDEAEHMD